MKKSKQQFFVSIIWGYPQRMHGLSFEENYHLHSLKIAKNNSFTPILIVKDSKEMVESDPNFSKDYSILSYKNIFNFIFLIIKYSFKGALFYVNSLEWQSFLVPFISRKTIFMAHTQPKRQTKNKQLIQNFVFKFFSAIRLNNEDEKQFLLNDGVNENKLFIIPLVVSQNVFKLTNNEKRSDLVCFGNITKKKNIITILKSFERVKKIKEDIKLNLIGTLWDEDVKIFVDNSEFADDIIFHGFLPNEKIAEELNNNLIYLNSSFDEGQCVAVYDAALCGCVLCLPKIMSFTGVFKDKALFHDVLDYQALADNIILYLNDVDLVEHNKNVCLDMIKNDYSIEVIEEKFSELINRFK